jgi:thiopurine S-methyltransferase
MEHNFWLDRWQTHQIGFHLADANPLLVKHFKALALPAGSRIFIPLCGKTLDIAWLLSQGYRVAGAELVEMAIVQLFDELGVPPNITKVGNLKRYSAHNIDVFVGDIFELTADMLGAVDATYDRAALVALPSEMRAGYTAHLKTITQHAPVLLITFEYDQALVPGPPFSVNAAEVKTHYADATLLECNDLPGGLKGQYPAQEATWLVGCARRR